jgi:hypothetical protein
VFAVPRGVAWGLLAADLTWHSQQRPSNAHPPTGNVGLLGL